MSLEKNILDRAAGTCELCAAVAELQVYAVPPKTDENADHHAAICQVCLHQIEKKTPMDSAHWRCLNDSMWSEVPAIKVISWRMLNRLRGEGWPQDLLEMIYLEEDDLTWAKSTGDHVDDEDKIIHKDSNGAILQQGDTVTLIKDLDVKGGGFTAKRGTAVRNISLVADNAEHIEGRVEGQHIVILTKYVKKSN